MTDLRTAAQQALEAMEYYRSGEDHQPTPASESITALRAALEQPEQEPVAWMVYTQDGKSVCVTDHPADFTDEHRALPLYAHPPRREWRGLTEEDIWTLAANSMDSVLGRLHFARAIEAALKEKNHE
jgi:hypothetical protein